MMFCDWKLYICGDNGLKFFGKGPQILLYGVERLGSLHQAAAEMNLSYSKALHMIQTAKRVWGSLCWRPKAAACTAVAAA